jgi:hypothetical protein
MRFCDDHWSRLREKVDAAGLSEFIAKDGVDAARRQQQQFDEVAAALNAGESESPVTAETFDPLMGAHWAIVTNAMQMLDRGGLDPLHLLGANGTEPLPTDLLERGLKLGRRPTPATFPECPLCYLNLLHWLTCSGCSLPAEGGYDYFLDRAVGDQVEKARELELIT